MGLLLPHQEKAVSEMHNGCILKGGVGTGKSIAALAYYDDCENPGRLIVITTGKKRDSGDWEAEGRLLSIFPEVDSWNNIRKYEDIEGAFFIFDEQRVVGSGAWVKSFLKITKKNSWVLLSATPGDTWMDYIPVFVANGFYRNRTEFLNEHVVFDSWAKFPKVKAFLNTKKLVQHLIDVMVEMPYEKHTIRHEIDVFVDYDKEAYDVIWKRRWNEAESRPVRNISECLSLLRRCVNTGPGRLLQIRNLLIEHPRLIVFYSFDYELELLRALDVKTAEWNGHRHDPIPEGPEWAYLVQYASGSEGWNCFTTDTIVFYSLSYSYRMTAQAKGRIDRLGTPYTDLWYYTLKSGAPLDIGIATNLSGKRNFNEKQWAKEAHW